MSSRKEVRGITRRGALFLTYNISTRQLITYVARSLFYNLATGEYLACPRPSSLPDMNCDSNNSFHLCNTHRNDLFEAQLVLSITIRGKIPTVKIGVENLPVLKMDEIYYQKKHYYLLLHFSNTYRIKNVHF